MANACAEEFSGIFGKANSVLEVPSRKKIGVLTFDTCSVWLVCWFGGKRLAVTFPPLAFVVAVVGLHSSRY
jgi:hypothetical protein